MRFVRALVTFAFCLSLPLAGIAEASDSIAPVNLPVSPGRSAKQDLLADCTETVIQPSPLSARPVLSRATYASRPALRHKRPHKKIVHKNAVAKKTVAKKKVAATGKPVAHRKTVGAHPGKHKARRPIHRRPAEVRPVLHSVSYASPLCNQRTQAVTDLLGLGDLAFAPTQPLVAADAQDVQNVVFPLAPIYGYYGGGGGGTGGGGTTNPGFPGGPGFPGNPVFPIVPGGPVVIVPGGPDTPGTPVTPGGPDQPGTPITPITPPPAPSAVPEPASWATMMLGMGLVGGSIRRRRRVAAKS